MFDKARQTEMRQVLSKAEQLGVRIVTVGLGSDHPSRIPTYNSEREFTGYLKADGRVLTCEPASELPLAQRYQLF